MFTPQTSDILRRIPSIRTFKMGITKSLFYFIIGLLAGGLITTVTDRIYEGGWRGGPTIVWLSIPVTTIYFLLLLGVTAWQPSTSTRLGWIITGILCNIFPFVSGFFPLYYFRALFAVPVALAQFVLLVISLVVVSKIVR